MGREKTRGRIRGWKKKRRVEVHTRRREKRSRHQNRAIAVIFNLC